MTNFKFPYNRYNRDGIDTGMEPVMDQLRRKIADAVARGEIVRLTCGEQTIGFIGPNGMIRDDQYDFPRHVLFPSNGGE